MKSKHRLRIGHNFCPAMMESSFYKKLSKREQRRFREKYGAEGKKRLMMRKDWRIIIDAIEDGTLEHMTEMAKWYTLMQNAPERKILEPSTAKRDQPMY